MPAKAQSFDSKSKSLSKGQLIGWPSVDGDLFGAFGNEWGWEAGAMGYGALSMGWNPTLAGFSMRFAGALEHQGSASPEENAAHRRVNYADYAFKEAWLQYPTELFAWTASFQAGWFRWRSHEDAALAGEYLTHGKAYTWDRSGDRKQWEALDSLTAVFQGLRFSLKSPGKRFGQEAIVFLDTEDTETSLSLLLSTTVTPRPGMDLGFAAVWDEFIKGEPTVSMPARSQVLADTHQVVQADTAPYSWYRMRSQHYSARITLDPLTLITRTPRDDRGGRFYFESAVTGLEKIPASSGDWKNQLHVTGGLFLPAFGLLNTLRIQGEFWPESPVTNSLQAIYDRAIPVPGSIGTTPTSSDSTATFSPSTNLSQHEWAWRWQLYLSRALLPWLDLQAKVIRARDLSHVMTRFTLSANPVREPSLSWTAFELRLNARL